MTCHFFHRTNPSEFFDAKLSFIPIYVICRFKQRSIWVVSIQKWPSWRMSFLQQILLSKLSCLACAGSRGEVSREWNAQSQVEAAVIIFKSFDHHYRNDDSRRKQRCVLDQCRICQRCLGHTCVCFFQAWSPNYQLVDSCNWHLCIYLNL